MKSIKADVLKYHLRKRGKKNKCWLVRTSVWCPGFVRRDLLSWQVPDNWSIPLPGLGQIGHWKVLHKQDNWTGTVPGCQSIYAKKNGPGRVRTKYNGKSWVNVLRSSQPVKTLIFWVKTEWRCYCHHLGGVDVDWYKVSTGRTQQGNRRRIVYDVRIVMARPLSVGAPVARTRYKALC